MICQQLSTPALLESKLGETPNLFLQLVVRGKALVQIE